MTGPNKEGSMHPGRTDDIVAWSDEPVAGGRKDLLGFTPYARAVARLVLKAQTPITIGLHGPWGAGKTSLMNLVYEQIAEEEQVVPIWFNPWMHQGDTSPLMALLDAVRAKAEAAVATQETLETLSVLKEAFPGGTLGDVFATPARSLQGAQQPARTSSQREVVQSFSSRFRDDVRAVVGDAGRLVVFVDDLDRCLPDRVIDILDALKLFLTVERTVFVLAVDPAVVATGLMLRYQRPTDAPSPSNTAGEAAGYLDKLVQIPFEMPPLLPGRVVTYLRTLLAAVLQEDDSQGYEQCINIVTRGLAGNPRLFKRFANVFLVKDSIGRETVRVKYLPGCLCKVMVLQFGFSSLYRSVCNKRPSLLLELQSLARQEGGDPDRALADRVQTAGVDCSGFGPVGLARLAAVLKMEPVIENPGVLLEHLHLARAASPESYGPGALASDRRDFSRTCLDGADLHGMNLNGLCFDGSTFKGANLSDAFLEDASFRDTSFEGADLSEARLQRTDLASALFKGATFRRTLLAGATLDGADFRGAILDEDTLDELRAARPPVSCLFDEDVQGRLWK